MSIMGINHSLIPSWNMAVTAMFEELSLPIIKPIVGMINCRGVICESNLSPFFMFTHEPVNADTTRKVFANCPRFIMRLNPQGRAEIPLSSLIGGLGE